MESDVEETGAPLEVEYFPEEDGWAELGVRDAIEVHLENQQFAAKQAATRTPEYRITWLSKDASLVAYVSITSMESRWIEFGTGETVVTDVTFTTGEILRGGVKPPEAIAVAGGTIDGTRVINTSTPKLVVGQEYLAFLAFNNQTWVLIDALQSNQGAVALYGEVLTRDTLSELVAPTPDTSGGGEQ